MYAKKNASRTKTTFVDVRQALQLAAQRDLAVWVCVYVAVCIPFDGVHLSIDMRFFITCLFADNCFLLCAVFPDPGSPCVISSTMRRR